MLARFILAPFALFLLIAAPAAVDAQERPAGRPTATISIHQLQVAFIASGAIGGGTLTYNGRSYPISVSGLGVGGIGASQLSASGVVYGLRNRVDLAGVYAQVRAGWALGNEGEGALWLSNNKGVTMQLTTHRRGLHLAIGADGVVIGFK